jgi:hypothetical protein
MTPFKPTHRTTRDVSAATRLIGSIDVPAGTPVKVLAESPYFGMRIAEMADGIPVALSPADLEPIAPAAAGGGGG